MSANLLAALQVLLAREKRERADFFVAHTFPVGDASSLDEAHAAFLAECDGVIALAEAAIAKAVARIPAGRLKRTRSLLDFLIGDLRQLHGLLEQGDSVGLRLLYACETQILQMLDEISPEIRRAIAEEQRYLAAPLVGSKMGGAA